MATSFLPPDQNIFFSSKTLSNKPSLASSYKPSVKKLHLTRRGRIVVIIVPLVIVGAIFMLLSTTTSSQADNDQTATKHVVVSEGQSLWSIASQIPGNASTSEKISQIKSLNNLSSSTVETGQLLIVPHG